MYTRVMYQARLLGGGQAPLLKYIIGGGGGSEMHGRMHPNYCQKTILLVVDSCSSLAYFIMTHPLPIAGKLPIKKTLVARL